MIVITPMDIQMAAERNKDHDCRFNGRVISNMHALSFEIELQRNLDTVAAEIMLRDYVPGPIQQSCFAGYGQGDDNLYPID